MAAQWFCACCRNPGPGAPRALIPPEAPPNSITKGGRKRVWPSRSFSYQCPPTEDGLGTELDRQQGSILPTAPHTRLLAGCQAGLCPPRHSTAPPPQKSSPPSGLAEAIHDWVPCALAQEQTLLLSHFLACLGWWAVPWLRPVALCLGQGPF